MLNLACVHVKRRTRCLLFLFIIASILSIIVQIIHLDLISIRLLVPSITAVCALIVLARVGSSWCVDAIEILDDLLCESHLTE